MRRLDSRRLTGPNLLWDYPGAVLDVAFEGGEPDQEIAAWQSQARRMLDAVDWRKEQTCVRRFRDGASLAISAPVDALYSATDVNDWAFDSACDIKDGLPEPDIEHDAIRLAEIIRNERNPGLITLRDAAESHNKPILIDTKKVSVGLGCFSKCWTLDKVPYTRDVPWDELDSIPVALITGTNGKTTSVRLAASIARSGGATIGLSSTDWIAAGDNILDTGDYSGPGGARTVLRDRGVDLAILETARGGLLRRGLAVTRADAVLITNVASDHLGEFGIYNIEELADVKWIVTRALDEDSTLVLNADDPRLVERAQGTLFNITWFSPDPDNPVLEEHARRGGTVCTVIDECISVVRAGGKQFIVPVSAIPITFNGAAVHNIYNALGVTGLTLGLGLEPGAIAAGLRAMEPNDNPGRSNVYRINGATVVVDFAHNPHGMEAFVKMAAAMPAHRRILLIGQAGDRNDMDIRGLATTACTTHWDQIVIKEMDDYARGRERGEAADILYDEFILRGIPGENIDRQRHELEAVKTLVTGARPEDLIILLIHEQRGKVLDYLKKMAEEST